MSKNLVEMHSYWSFILRSYWSNAIRVYLMGCRNKDEALPVLISPSGIGEEDQGVFVYGPVLFTCNESSCVEGMGGRYKSKKEKGLSK